MEKDYKIPYFKNRIKSIPPINEIAASITEPLSLWDIRKEQLQNRAKEQEEILNVALDYTRKSFALYLSDEHLDMLCRNLQAYINELDVKELQPVKIKELTAIDIFRFGETNAIAENINSRIQRFIMINQGTRDREFFYFCLHKYFS